jgi:hypothetical protein
MRWVLNKQLVWIVLLVFASYMLVPNAKAGTRLGSGEKTADEAASLRSDDGAGDNGDIPLRYTISMGHTFAEPDTTEFEFPGEEKNHLVRDVTIFVIVAVFAAYFIVKVFLEGDTEDEVPDEGNGKPTPL